MHVPLPKLPINWFQPEHLFGNEGNRHSELTVLIYTVNEGVRECHDRGHEYGLPESAFYFLEALSRLSESNYIPTEQDILRSRAKTTGVVEIFFHYKVQLTYLKSYLQRRFLC